MKRNIESIRITIHYLGVILSLYSCEFNETDNGVLTSVKLTEEHFGEMVTSESAEGIDTLIYVEVYVNNDSIVSWQSQDLNIGVNIMFEVDSSSSIKIYNFNYHELDAILNSNFKVKLVEQNAEYTNHRKLNVLKVGRSSFGSYMLLNTKNGWSTLSVDELDQLVWFSRVFRERKKLDAQAKLVHRSHHYIGDEVHVVTRELIE